MKLKKMNLFFAKIVHKINGLTTNEVDKALQRYKKENKAAILSAINAIL